VAAGARILQVSNEQQLAEGFGEQGAFPGTYGSGSAGDGGPASQARFFSARSLARDEAGNLFIADLIDPKSATFRIRVINFSGQPLTFYQDTAEQLVIQPGHIQTIAGVAGLNNSADGGPALKATLRGVPPSMATSPGRLYIALRWKPSAAESRKSIIRVINLTGAPTKALGVAVQPGAIATVAGRGDTGFSGDGGKALGARLSYIPGITASPDGTLFLADHDNHRIRRIDGGGILKTIAGQGTAGFNGNGRKAETALLNRPYDVKLAASGRLLIADRGNGLIRQINENGRIEAGPGSGIGNTSSCRTEQTASGGSPPRLVAHGISPSDIAIRADGTAIISLLELGRIQHIRGTGNLSNVVSSNVPVAASAPTAIAVRKAGGLYVLEASGQVNFINDTSARVTVHGHRIMPKGAKRILRLQTEERLVTYGFREHSSIEADHLGNIYITDFANERIVQVDSRGVTKPVAGRGAPSAGACCRNPVDLALDSAGNLYIADLAPDEIRPLAFARPRVWVLNPGSNARVVAGRRVGPGEAVVIAGNGEVGFGGEGGLATNAQMLIVTGVAVDSTGNVFTSEIAPAPSDRFGYIRKIDRTGSIRSIGGNGLASFNGDGLNAKLSTMYPRRIAADNCGNVLFIDDTRVRRLNQSPSC